MTGGSSAEPRSPSSAVSRADSPTTASETSTTTSTPTANDTIVTTPSAPQLMDMFSFLRSGRSGDGLGGGYVGRHQRGEPGDEGRQHGGHDDDQREVHGPVPGFECDGRTVRAACERQMNERS